MSFSSSRFSSRLHFTTFSFFLTSLLPSSNLLSTSSNSLLLASFSSLPSHTSFLPSPATIYLYLKWFHRLLTDPCSATPPLLLPPFCLICSTRFVLLPVFFCCLSMKVFEKKWLFFSTCVQGCICTCVSLCG